MHIEAEAIICMKRFKYRALEGHFELFVLEELGQKNLGVPIANYAM